MKTFPAAFTIEKNKKVGGKPRWILRLTVSAVDYYLAPVVFTIPSFAGSTPWPASTVVNTLAWVQQFGEIVEGINGALDEFHTSEMTDTFIIDRSVTTNIETLALAGIEGCVAELYQWYVGCTDPPQRIWAGKVRAVTELNDTTVTVAFQDETIDLENFYVGTKVAVATYPNADPEDVGKVIPIPFGSVNKIAALCIKATADYVYIYSDRAVISAPAVYVRNKSIADINITSYCTIYTGQAGSELTGYSGKGVVKITAAQAAQIQALVSIALADVGHSHNTSAGTAEDTTTGLPTSIYYNFTLVFPTDGERSGVSYSFTYLPNATGNGVHLTAQLTNSSGAYVYDAYVNMTGGTPFTFTFYVAGDVRVDQIYIYSGGMWGQITDASRVVQTTDVPSSSSLTGSVLTKPSPSKAVSEMILVDAAADCGNPADAASYITNSAGKADTTVSGALTTPTINGLINEYQSALWLLNKIAFECGAWFAIVNGSPKFISRHGSGSSKTIEACQIDGSGKRVLSRVKTDVNDLVNNITILYNRDWTQDESDKSYLSSIKDTVGDGLHERPELFRFWFVSDYASASAALSLYLGMLQTQKWFATSAFFLDQSEIEFGDTVVLTYINQSGIVISASHAPGSYNKIHTVKLKVLI